MQYEKTRPRRAFLAALILSGLAFKDYEEKFREELDSVYELLSAQAFSIRTNMNLSLRTNHYLTHEFHEDICPDCLEHYQYLVEKMPPMPERDQIWFDYFNKDLVDMAKDIANEKENKDE